MKDGKLLYEAEKCKRESFGKLFSECFLQYTLCRHLSCHADPVTFDLRLCLFRKVLSKKPSVQRTRFVASNIILRELDLKIQADFFYYFVLVTISGNLMELWCLDTKAQKV